MPHTKGSRTVSVNQALSVQVISNPVPQINLTVLLTKCLGSDNLINVICALSGRCHCGSLKNENSIQGFLSPSRLARVPQCTHCRKYGVYQKYKHKHTVRPSATKQLILKVHKLIMIKWNWNSHDTWKITYIDVGDRTLLFGKFKCKMRHLKYIRSTLWIWLKHEPYKNRSKTRNMLRDKTNFFYFILRASIIPSKLVNVMENTETVIS